MMRVFIQPRNGDSFEKVLNQATRILQDSQIAPTQTEGASAGRRSALLIDPSDLPEALEILERAGMRVVVN